MQPWMSSLTLACTILCLAPPAHSQSGKTFLRYNRPLKTLSLDLATGTLSRGPAVQDRAAGTTIDFYNNDLGGFVGVDTGNGFCEWFDAGVKGNVPNSSDLMSEIVFAYCSSKLAVGSGGPGGAVKLGYYEGYTAFGGAPTTAVAVFTLTGLPANTASSSFFGGFNCFFLRVTFTDVVAFADGPIGYSWKFLDLGADGTLAGTWPFLSCVVSCSGAILQVDGQGMTDVIDEYCPAGTLRATFTFGTVSGSFTSMSLDIREIADLSATYNAYNANATPNPDTLAETAAGSGRAVVGQPWSVTVTRPAGVLNNAVLVVRPTRVPIPNGIQGPPPLPIGAGGRLLISGPALTTLGGVGVGLQRTFATNQIPVTLTLICIHWAAQSTLVGGGVRVSSAVEGTTGTF